MAVVAGCRDDLFGIDVATGEQMWKKHFDNTLAGSHRRPRSDNVSVPADRPRCRRSCRDRRPASTRSYVDVVGRPAAAGQSGGRTGCRAAREVHAAATASRTRLNLVNGVIYTASAQGCGGVPNAFYSFDLATEEVQHLPAGRRRVVGPARRRDRSRGRVYIGTGDARFDAATRSLGNGIVAVKIDANKQLQLADYFAPKNANWLQRRDLDVNVTPMAFDYKGTKFLVGTSKECRLWLLDRDNLGGEDHRTPLYTSPLHLQRHPGVRREGRLGIDGHVAGRARHAVGARRRSGDRSARSSTRPIEYGRPKMGGVARAQAEQVGGQMAAHARVAVARHGHGRRGVIANGVVFAYGAGEDSTQTVQDARVERAGPGVRWAADCERRAPPHSRIAARRAGARSTDRPARNSGRAARRSRRGITSAD